MFFNKQLRRINVDEYAIADIVFITNGYKPSMEIVKSNCLIVKDSKHRGFYRDVKTGVIHETFNGIYRNIHSWNTKYSIKKKLIDFYPELKYKKITDEEAIQLFERFLTFLINENSEEEKTEDFPKIKKLSIKGIM